METPGSWSLSNASTPPQRAGRSPSSIATPSRVEALFDAQTCVSFIDGTPLFDAAEGDGKHPAVTFRYAGAESESVQSHQCRSCSSTYRLRHSLKQIEEQYVTTIESLRLQLQEAVAQRAMAVKERNALLNSADTAVAHQVQAEQEAQELRMKMTEASLKNEILQRRALELGKENADDRERYLKMTRALLEEAETAERAQVEAAEKDETALLLQLCTSDLARVSALTPATSSSIPPQWAVAAVKLPATKHLSTCRNLSTDFSSINSSPGPSDESRGRQTCSPRHSPQRSLSAPVEMRRLPYLSHSKNTEGHCAAVTCRCSPGIAPVVVETRAAVVDDSVREKIKRLEWNLEQQRSSYEVQLAEEQALTREMQDEIDDLIENELMLLETNDRVALERDSAEAVIDIVRCLRTRLGVALPARPPASQDVLATDPTRPGAASTTCCGTHVGELCEGQELPTSEVVPAVCDGPADVFFASSANPQDFASTANETRPTVHEIRDNNTCCPTTLVSAGAQQERMELLLRQVLKEVEGQRRQAEETYSALRQFSRISTHNDEALFRAVGRVETAVKAPRRTAGFPESSPADVQPGAPISSTCRCPPPQLHRGARGTTSAAALLSPSTTTSSAAADVSRTPTPPSPSMNVVVAEEELFDPSRIRVDAYSAAEKMAAFLSQDSLSESSSGRVLQTPYDVD
ncbi:hypothetical protein JKF63_04523 [Porcisia hertigi]|uniref:Uncharacterized protein n=1 Tax=Porcisia hertigi TaxID=2761500 RepID=A0A836I192_9TRYP|nr:hypothetical protein JKF63_04523 [Porcisia hertigi]